VQGVEVTELLTVERRELFYLLDQCIAASRKLRLVDVPDSELAAAGGARQRQSYRR
jgi:hypothetical protein